MSTAGESKKARRERLAKFVADMPTEPGVYLFHDRGGRVVYVGKAKSLRARVRTYFGSPSDLTPKVRRQVDTTHSLDFIVTRSEMEALLLEYNLIKEHRPRYNIVYRDDKKYPYLRVTLSEPFPRVFPTRKIENDGSRYFGPYTDVGAMRQTLRILRTIFPMPTCTLRLTEGMSERGCLDYFLGRCVGPCRGDVDPDEYRNLVEEVMLFLNGKKDDVVSSLEREMKQASREMRYEDAAKIRDRLASLKKTVAKQHVTMESKDDVDAMGFRRLGKRAIGVCIQVRGGRVVGRDRIEVGCTPQTLDGEIVRSLLLGFYEPREAVPRTIFVGKESAEPELMADWLEGKTERKVEVRVPQRGTGVRLLEMAEHNAEVALAGDLEKSSSEELVELQKALGLEKAPQRIEGYDISTIQGTDTYASMVVFEGGSPEKSEYRTFRIREAPKRDDPRAIEEAIRRRSRRIQAGGSPPELILIDGGPTQLDAACRALREADLLSIPIVSLAKKEELIHFPARPEPLRLPKSSAALKLLQRVRDESHRFALRAHRRRRGGRVSASVLDEIPGIGPARKKTLIQTFGSVDGIRQAGLDEISTVPGVGREVALALWTHLGGAEEK